ncbi:MAG TPA: alpha/beta hydrolase [Acidimicrobiia bacterium]|jgi:pimeloyl-ACP methyl ester carboxylesterase|nr:alpha/beta hydrolase [Acidimicrobiia bacterium]
MAQTEFAQRGDVKLAYETVGRGEPPIVFVHGWSCDRSFFSPQVEHFASRHAVASIDLHGHGESSRPEPGAGRYSIDAFADDVLAVAADAGFERPVVIGHSMGGVTALACAARPGAVRAAVLVDPAPMVNAWVKEYLAGVVDNIETDTDGAYRTDFVGNMFLPTDTARRAEIIAGMSEMPCGPAAAAMRGIIDFDSAAALGNVEVPLLTIGSATASDQPAELRGACPTITIGQTVGAGHFNQLEVPDQVNAMIERFFAVNGIR